MYLCMLCMFIYVCFCCWSLRHALSNTTNLICCILQSCWRTRARDRTSSWLWGLNWSIELFELVYFELVDWIGRSNYWIGRLDWIVYLGKGDIILFVRIEIRSVVIISNRRISNWESQSIKTNMSLMCPYCLRFQIARVQAARTNLKSWKLTVAEELWEGWAMVFVAVGFLFR